MTFDEFAFLVSAGIILWMVIQFIVGSIFLSRADKKEHRDTTNITLNIAPVRNFTGKGYTEAGRLLWKRGWKHIRIGIALLALSLCMVIIILPYSQTLFM